MLLGSTPSICGCARDASKVTQQHPGAPGVLETTIGTIVMLSLMSNLTGETFANSVVGWIFCNRQFWVKIQSQNRMTSHSV